MQGAGPDVVLIPGLSTSRSVWDGTVKALDGKYRLHLVQIRGFGDDAGVNSEGPVLEPFVAELADYIDDEITNKGRAARQLSSAIRLVVSDGADDWRALSAAWWAADDCRSLVALYWHDG